MMKKQTIEEIVNGIKKGTVATIGLVQVPKDKHKQINSFIVDLSPEAAELTNIWDDFASFIENSNKTYYEKNRIHCCDFELVFESDYDGLLSKGIAYDIARLLTRHDISGRFNTYIAPEYEKLNKLFDKYSIDLCDVINNDYYVEFKVNRFYYIAEFNKIEFDNRARYTTAILALLKLAHIDSMRYYQYDRTKFKTNIELLENKKDQFGKVTKDSIEPRDYKEAQLLTKTTKDSIKQLDEKIVEKLTDVTKDSIKLPYEKPQILAEGTNKIQQNCFLTNQIVEKCTETKNEDTDKKLVAEAVKNTVKEIAFTLRSGLKTYKKLQRQAKSIGLNVNEFIEVLQGLVK